MSFTLNDWTKQVSAPAVSDKRKSRQCFYCGEEVLISDEKLYSSGRQWMHAICEGVKVSWRYV